ncbi:uncharacterized protein BT62DRAFT_1005016 [Guyanagaster necrorhizus]|uniref:Protein kinase domain-containing protein n=1 Tax=Guyanagaster necrorhizus TaxID=856835 RepID=A0A9P7VVV2_9AGAR|nr:uncharacterized protein BT62DRAFT_1005016 [Guyanagaster necrorhizus MCA 3950]KAG7447405.1 hypothetical protein BT62DRAFT_1005016 [Guyanagaster necrorhizus MCA 3950]
MPDGTDIDLYLLIDGRERLLTSTTIIDTPEALTSTGEARNFWTSVCTLPPPMIVVSIHDIQYSQVWVSDVYAFGEHQKFLGKVIMKIIQPSLICLPHPNWYLEAQDYELKPLEGSTVPCYFGKQKVTMPAEEDADVLFMEYVEGNTLEQWKEDRPAHEKREDLGNANEAYMEETKEMMSIILKKVLLGVDAFNKLGIGHRDIRSSNIIITPSGEPV